MLMTQRHSCLRHAPFGPSVIGLLHGVQVSLISSYPHSLGVISCCIFKVHTSSSEAQSCSCAPINIAFCSSGKEPLCTF